MSPTPSTEQDKQQQQQQQTDNGATSLVCLDPKPETLESIFEYLKTEQQLTSIENEIDCEPLLKFKQTCEENQKGRNGNSGFDWVQFEECYQIIFNEYYTNTLEIIEQMNKCDEVC